VYAKEKRNKMPREILANHLGYRGLNGRSLVLIGALRAYGLIEGTGDDVRVSDDAIVLLNAPLEAPERHETLVRCAFRPALFQEVRSHFENTPSEGVLRYTFIKRGFTPEAAEEATQSYLATEALVRDVAITYNHVSPEEGAKSQPGTGLMVVPGSVTAEMSPWPPHPDGRPEMRREVITLDEGDVVITFPENLSTDSFADLKAHMDLFIKKMQRRTKITDQELEDLIGPNPPAT
jgi:hypothetical protein